MTDGRPLSEELLEGIFNQVLLIELPQHGFTLAGVTIPNLS